MNAFFQSLTFLTRIPVRFQAKPEAWPKSTAYYPLVGLILGLIVAAVAVVSSFLLPTMLVAVISVVSWIWLTGGLHMDGLMDTADAVGSSRKRERMLEIMKDSRVGAMGAIAAILVIVVKFASIYAIIEGIHERSTHSSPDLFTVAGVFVPLILVPPILARAGLLVSIYFWPYLNPSGGIASGMKEGLTPLRLGLALLFAVVSVLLISETFWGLLFIGIWMIITFFFNQRMQKLLGGLTGDTYGCLTEITEAVLLIAGAACVHTGGLI